MKSAMNGGGYTKWLPGKRLLSARASPVNSPSPSTRTGIISLPPPTGAFEENTNALALETGVLPKRCGEGDPRLIYRAYSGNIENSYDTGKPLGPPR